MIPLLNAPRPMPLLNATAQHLREMYDTLPAGQRLSLLLVLVQDHTVGLRTSRDQFNVLNQLAEAVAEIGYTPMRPVEGPVHIEVSLLDDTDTPFSVSVLRQPPRFLPATNGQLFPVDEGPQGQPQLLVTNFHLRASAMARYAEQAREAVTAHVARTSTGALDRSPD